MRILEQAVDDWRVPHEIDLPSISNDQSQLAYRVEPPELGDHRRRHHQIPEAPWLEDRKMHGSVRIQFRFDCPEEFEKIPALEQMAGNARRRRSLDIAKRIPDGEAVLPVDFPMV